jgi:hypothetical protein
MKDLRRRPFAVQQSRGRLLASGLRRPQRIGDSSVAMLAAAAALRRNDHCPYPEHKSGRFPAVRSQPF